MQVLTPQSTIHFSEALVPAESALWLCMCGLSFYEIWKIMSNLLGIGEVGIGNGPAV